jgi:hypothetical protein
VTIGQLWNAARLSLATAIVVAAGSLALGAALAGPFFGTIELRLGDPRALLPALVLAVPTDRWRKSPIAERCPVG